MTDFIYRFFSGSSAKSARDADASSEFSKFFRTAPSSEKKKIFLDVARKANEDQRRVLESA